MSVKAASQTLLRGGLPAYAEGRATCLPMLRGGLRACLC